MTASKSSLTNCYTPLPASPRNDETTTTTTTTATAPNSRTYGDNTPAPRPANALRRILMDTSILSQSTGSALLELGQTKILCSVHGPRSSSASFGRTQFRSDGFLNCEVRYAPHFGIRA
eukprot:CAMPEP_0172501774 /NCGR_PEP_ID=MMETSP1066-20121228/153395_1 /TAXON_ID=671091 /ORGANISM="Coscinodiscus wailesii, Strain CCMP2513" /LENGTH=118 /DNA_ID=CAMNT_0013276753 /DNA_START=120 /DNA_END=472 /DNA_ORIENTATION=-